LVPKSEILEHYMPMLDLPSHEPAFLLFMKLEQELDDEMKRYLVHGRLSLHVAKMLLEINHEMRPHAIHLMSKLRFNINQQKQLIEYLTDLSYIDNGALSDLLAGRSIEDICSDNGLNVPQKAKAVLRLLRTMRFPALSQAERAFHKRTSGLDLPDGVRITAPPYFEASNYKLELSFKNGKDLKEKIVRLARAGGLEDLRDPWMKEV
ncbi:MAG: hypothetical protein SV775_14745, partial [Thermodesulfobacteriota bacterium]|nr:hypothetical protein [Thermodesulfobacteriota bacterium]